MALAISDRPAVLFTVAAASARCLKKFAPLWPAQGTHIQLVEREVPVVAVFAKRSCDDAVEEAVAQIFKPLVVVDQARRFVGEGRLLQFGWQVLDGLVDVGRQREGGIGYDGEHPWPATIGVDYLLNRRLWDRGGWDAAAAINWGAYSAD